MPAVSQNSCTIEETKVTGRSVNCPGRGQTYTED